MRAVFDTNILVAAMRSPSGASVRILEAAQRGELTLIANVALFTEWEAVLTRAEHLRAAKVSAKQVVVALDTLAALVEPVERRSTGGLCSQIPTTRW